MPNNNPTYKVLIPGLPFKTKYGGFGYCSISIIRDGEDIILFDVGHYAVRGELIKILKKYNVNKVFLSHLHYDHCVNIDLLCKAGIKIYLNKKEYKYLDNIKVDDIYTYKPFKKVINKNNLELFDGEINITKNIKAIETIGHSPGHSSLVFSIKNKSVIMAGDSIKTYKEYKKDNCFSVAPYDLKKYKETREMIINNFDIIIPGHSSLIIDGKYKLDKIEVESL